MEKTTLQENNQQRRAILLFYFIVVVGWFLYFSLYFICTRYYHSAYFDFLNDKADCFRDFAEVNRAAMLGDPYIRGNCSNYPPLALLLGKLFSAVYPDSFLDMTPLMIKNTPIDRMLFYCVFGSCTVAISLLILLLIRKYAKLSWLSSVTLAAASMYSMAYIFCLDRGNYIVFAYVAFLVFLLTFQENEIPSGIALAVCACLKVYPVIFILLFVLFKKWKGFFACLISGILGLILPFFAFKGNLIDQFKGFFSSVLGFGDIALTYSNPLYPFAYLEQKSNSLENIFRAFAMVIGYGEHSAQTKIVGIAFFECVSTIFALVSILMIIYITWKNPVWWKKLTVLILAIILLPGNTFDYMLLFLVPCIIFMIANGDPKDYKYIVLLTIAVFIPKNWYYFETGIPDVSVQCIINPLLLWVTLLLLFIDTVQQNKEQLPFKKIRKMGCAVMACILVFSCVTTYFSCSSRVTIDYSSGIQLQEYSEREKNGFPQTFKLYWCEKTVGLTVINSSINPQQVCITFTTGYDMDLRKETKYSLRCGDQVVEASLDEEGQTMSFEVEVPFGETDIILEVNGRRASSDNDLVYFTMADLSVTRC